MPTFNYKAKKENAETVLGQISASDQEEAVDLINRMGLIAVSVESRFSQDVGSESLQKRIRPKEIYSFTRQFLNLLKSGISILRALEIIESQIRNPSLKSIVASIDAGIRDGRALSDCLGDYRLIFPPLYVNLIKAGEESGNLKDVLSNISEYQRGQMELLSKLKSAAIYPIFMGAVGFVTVIFILTFVLPRMMGLFSSMKEELPLATSILLNFSKFLQNWFFVIMSVCAIGAFFLSKFLSSAKGKNFISRLQMKLPLLNTFIIKVEIARVTRTLEMLLRGGLPILRSIQIAVPVLSNDLIKEAFTHAQSELMKGNSLGKSLRQSPYIPPAVCDLIVVGEESGLLTDILREIAAGFEEETKETMKVITSLMEPVMILSIGLVVGFIVFAMLLPIFQIDSMMK